MVDDARRWPSRQPATRCNGDVNLAYQVHGDGPIDLLLVSSFISHVEHVWENPGFARFLTRLVAVLAPDHLGPARLGAVGQRAARRRARDRRHQRGARRRGQQAAGGARLQRRRPAGGAVRRAPPRARRARSCSTAACCTRSRDDDLPWVESRGGARPAARRAHRALGRGDEPRVLAPTAADDPQLRAWLARLERLAASPGQARRLVDGRAARPTCGPALASIAAPTLVLHRTDEVFVDVRHGREYARRIPGAQLVELPGVDSLPSAGDTDALLGEIEEFLTGGRRGGEQERALLTVLFTDIVGSTARAAELGDKRWRDLLAVHDTEVRRTLRALRRRRHPAHRRRLPRGLRRRAEPRRALRARAARGRRGARRRPAHRAAHGRVRDHRRRRRRDGRPHRRARRRARRARARSSSRGRRTARSSAPGLDFDYRGEKILKGVPGRWPIFALNALSAPRHDERAPARSRARARAQRSEPRPSRRRPRTGARAAR